MTSCLWRMAGDASSNRRCVFLMALALGACGGGEDAGSGALNVLLEPDATITAGLDAGEADENIRDGWQVRFDQYLLAIGPIELHSARDPDLRAVAPEVFVVDLAALPESGLPLWRFDDLASGRWDFHYSTPSARGGARHDSTPEVDFARMQENDWTYLITGRITNADGRSCPPARLASAPAQTLTAGENGAGDVCYANQAIAFSFGVPAHTVYGPCEVDGVPGASVASGGTQTVAATIHGDHLFFNGFPEGDEGGILRLAQWLADSDLDVNGVVTPEELSNILPADLVELDERYQLGGAPVNPLTDMWTYVRAQLMTQGHMDGEGECPPTTSPGVD